jgi:hypothetical protein
MTKPPDDLDATRAAIATKELVATASGYLTGDVALSLPFEALGPFKNLLLRFFSAEPWGEDDAAALADLVTPHLKGGWWEHDLGGGIALTHGVAEDRYVLWVSGASAPGPSIFNRVFDGPVVPEATPHPRKVKFVTGGHPAPGVWYRRTDPDPPDDPGVKRLFAEPDVTDVMVAGDFVTIGIGARWSWERRLEPLLALVTELYSRAEEAVAPVRTRDQLLTEASARADRSEELHLLDPDDAGHRDRLTTALADEDARIRRVAVAVLADSSDEAVRVMAVDRGAEDPSRIVRRTAVDAAADLADENLRVFFEDRLADEDHWIRWKAVRSIGDLGVGSSRPAITDLVDDPDFQVRFEVARVLRESEDS